VIIHNLAMMGIAIDDARDIAIDTYFELMDMGREGQDGTGRHEATQADIDRFLL
jgi:hypothetical protein